MTGAESPAETPAPTPARPPHPSTRRRPLPGRRWQRALLALTALLLLVWALLPAARGLSLIQNIHRDTSAPPASAAGIPVQDVRFTATDGVALAGWLALAAPTAPTAPTIILSHGYKGSRLQMRAQARFLYDAGYNVLFYDSRGCGQSAGWSITMGTREPDD